MRRLAMSAAAIAICAAGLTAQALTTGAAQSPTFQKTIIGMDFHPLVGSPPNPTATSGPG